MFARITLAVLAFLGLAGCSDNTPKTYPVSGKFLLAGGDVKQLAGHHVEASLESEPTVRASGIIGPDGGFTLETLHAGTILKGAREGKYQVRIVKADEDDDGRKLKRPPVAAKYFSFQSSTLSFSVPTTGDLTLTATAK